MGFACVCVPVRGAPSWPVAAVGAAAGWRPESAPRLVLPAAHRLRRASDYQRAVRGGQRHASSTLVVHHLAVDCEPRVLVGFAVGRSVGPAVVRNRVKRRLRHLMREYLDALAPGLTVIRANSQAATASAPVLGADLTRCLRRVDALRS